MLVRLLKESMAPSGAIVELSEEQAALLIRSGAAVSLPSGHPSGKERLEQNKMMRESPHNKGG